MNNMQRIETIKQATIKVQGMNCLNAKTTKPATNKAFLELIDNVLKDEYCARAGDSDSLSELDFN